MLFQEANKQQKEQSKNINQTPSQASQHNQAALLLEIGLMTSIFKSNKPKQRGLY